MRNKYRVVRDSFSGYEAQVRRWWFPVWCSIGVNTHLSVEAAWSLCEIHATAVVKEGYVAPTAKTLENDSSGRS